MGAGDGFFGGFGGGGGEGEGEGGNGDKDKKEGEGGEEQDGAQSQEDAAQDTQEAVSSLFFREDTPEIRVLITHTSVRFYIVPMLPCVVASS